MHNFIDYCSVGEHGTCKHKNHMEMTFQFERYLFSVYFVSYFPAQVMVIIGGLSSYIHPSVREFLNNLSNI